MMSKRDSHKSDLIQDYLDGALDPAREAEIARLVQDDPAWRAALRETSRLFAVLDAPLDRAPGADLVAGALARLAAPRPARARFGFFARFERGFVALGAGALAGALLFAGLLPGAESPRLVGLVAVEAARALSSVKAATIVFASGLSTFDWVARLVESLSTAVGALLVSSVREFTPTLPVALLLTVLTAMVLWRAERGHRERGIPHGFHFFA